MTIARSGARCWLTPRATTFSASMSRPLSVPSTIAAEIADDAFGHLVAVTTGEHRGERALAGPVRPHDRMHLAAVYREINAAQDLAAVREPRMQITDLEHWHRCGHNATITRRCLQDSRRAASAPRPRIPSAAP